MFKKRLFYRVLMLIWLPISMLSSSQIASADTDKICKTDIKSVIKAYEKALNGSDVNQVIKYYAQDGVFMPSGKPTSIGREQVIVAYQHVFKTLDLDVSFKFDEIVRRGDLAFVRTTSDGKIKFLDKNMTIENNSRELFVMKRIDGDWKISRYMFNETNTL